MLALASVWASKEAGWLDPRWLNVTLCSVGALFIGGAGIWVRRSIDAERKHGVRCSFCGRIDRNAGRLQRASHHTGASICAECAASVAGRFEGAGPLREPVRRAERALVTDIATASESVYQGEVFQTVARSWEPTDGEAQAIAQARAVTNERATTRERKAGPRRPVNDAATVAELRAQNIAHPGTNGHPAASLKEADYE